MLLYYSPVHFILFDCLLLHFMVCHFIVSRMDKVTAKGLVILNFSSVISLLILFLFYLSFISM